MRRYKISSRYISLLLALAMIIGMIPALELGALAAPGRTEASGVNLSATNKITMPIKIMDYESDGLLFDYMTSPPVSKDGPEDFIPESDYWADFTGTLPSSKYYDPDGDGVYEVRYGSGFDEVALGNALGNKTYTKNGSTMTMKTSFYDLGGKNTLKIERTFEGDTHLMWNLASFGSNGVTVNKVRYVTIVYLDFRNDAGDEHHMGISSSLDADGSTRYKSGNWSGWFELPSDSIGAWEVDFAVIDLHNNGNGMALNKTVYDLYLDFPMDDGDLQSFLLMAVGCFSNAGDAEQFGYWGAQAGIAANTDSGTYLGAGNTQYNIPKETYINSHEGFSLWKDSGGVFPDVSGLTDWLASRSSAGQQPLWVYGDPELSTDTARTYATRPITWANNATHVDISTAIGYKLFQKIGDTQAGGIATVGLLESALDENGYPVYKESVLNYMQTFLRNRFLNCLEYDVDGWMYYSGIHGARNGEVFGYEDGGQVDMDPNTPGVQGIPMDFATAISKHFGIERHARNLKGNTARTYRTGYGAAGSYASTMAKRAYLEGSWLECKEYIKTWWDLAYYMMHNLFVANSYNQLQNQYNYLQLSYDSTSKHYIFDSTFVTNTSGTSSVIYDTTNKTIGLGTVAYKAYADDWSENVYNPFTPVNRNSNGVVPAAGESSCPYYMEDGVNKNNVSGEKLTYDNNNYGFTMVCNGEFTFEESSNLMFHFDGDDDVYLFINGELVMDLGGTHNNTSSTINLNKYVDWAETVLKNRTSYTATEVARAEKLNLKDNETYSFDFYYMERHGTGANFRVETNINVVVPDLDVEKVASQNGVDVPNNGVVDNTKPVEYGFKLTNDGDTSKLYNLTFTDSLLGITLDSTNGLTQKYPTLTRDKNGDPLDVTDLEVYVDGYNGDPNRPSTKKTDTIKVTFDNVDELKQFLKDLSSDDGTQSTATDSLYSGNGLWAYGTVTIRGIYYTQSQGEQAKDSFTNTVRATATNGSYGLSGEATHTVFKFGEPAYFQWAGNEIIIDSEKLYTDLKNSHAYGGKTLPAKGNMILTLTDGSGDPMKYETVRVNDEGETVTHTNVSSNPGGDVYLKVNFLTGGMHFFYVTISDESGVADPLTIAISVFVVEAKDSAVVLDYGLKADLSSGNGLFSGDTVTFAAVDTINTVMAITGTSANPAYIKEDVSNLHNVANTENKLTTIQGTANNGTLNDYVAKLESPIYLRHNSPWVVEWKTTGAVDSALMLATEVDGSIAGGKYLFIKNDTSTTNADLIALGYRHETSGYLNYGVSMNRQDKVSKTALDDVNGHTFALVNKINTDSTNMVYLYVDGIQVGPMNDYWKGSAHQSDKDETWLPGQDFTFNYIGTTELTHAMDTENLEYLKVWEDGESYFNYRWENPTGTSTNFGELVAKETGEKGNSTNALTKYNTAAEGTDAAYYRNNARVHLVHDKEWTLEFAYEGLDLAGKNENTGTNAVDEQVLLMTSITVGEDGTSRPNGMEYLYLRADTGLVAFGRRDSAGYHNYGIDLKGRYDKDFDTTKKHTYRLENRIEADGKNMVYLIVDGVEIGAMEHYYKEGNYVSSGNDFYTGNDFAFLSIGHGYGEWAIDGTLYYLQVWEETGLTNSYEWNHSSGVFADASQTDLNGNRINFVGDSANGLIDGSGNGGTITSDEGTFELIGNDLTFTPNEFLQGGKNSIKVAVTLHNRDFCPTPLKDEMVDIANEVQFYKNISVIPATVVYYEDDFPAIQYTSKDENKFTQLGDGSDTLIQGSDYDQNYGSDDAYNDACVNMSGNSLSVITIDNNGPLASFDFSGTGFEIVARTNATNSGMLFVQVYKQSDLALDASGKIQYDATTGLPKVKNNATPVASIPVVTEFDNGDNLGAEELYQIPIIRTKNLAKDNYTAIIFGTPSNMVYDETNKVWVPQAPYDYLYLDGIRIFQPIGDTNAGYRDVENGAIFVEIRDQIIDGMIAVGEYDQGDETVSVSAGLTTWTENHLGMSTVGEEKYVGNAVNSVNDYLLLGPNNEVYMDGTFTNSAMIIHVKETDAAVHNLQIAIRAMDYGQFVGAGHIYEHVKIMYSVKDGNGFGWKELVTINNGTEQYYTIPYNECPEISNGCYQVVIQVQAAEADVPALASFTSLKYNGLAIGSVATAAAEGVGSVPGYEVLSFVSEQLMSTEIADEDEIKPGDSFKPDDTTTSDEPTLIPQYPSLSLKEEVYYNIYYTLENFAEGSVAEMGLVTFDSKMTTGTIDDAVDVVRGASYNGSGYVVRTNGIPAKNLADTLYFKIYARLNDGRYVYSNVCGYSALDYAESRLSITDDLAEKALIVAMLNYGAAAQEFFGYKTDALMNAGLSDELKTLVEDYNASMVTDLIRVDSEKVGQFAATADGFVSKRPSVSLIGAFSINYYFAPEFEMDNGMSLYYWTEDAYSNATVLSVDNASGILTMTDLGDGQCWASVDGIAAKDIGKTIFVAGVYQSNGTTCSTGVLPYSLSAYCKNYAEVTSSDVQNIAAAIAVYGYYAENYFAN